MAGDQTHQTHVEAPLRQRPLRVGLFRRLRQQRAERRREHERDHE